MTTPSVGEQLKRVRIARQLTIKDVTKATKIQSWTLEALEADQLHTTMSPVYVKGFLSTYARYLHLDAGTLVAQLFPEPAPTPQESDDTSTAQVVPRLLEVAWPLLQRLGRLAMGVAAIVLLVRVNPLRWVSARVPHQEASLSIAEKPGTLPTEAVLRLPPTQPLELVLVARHPTWVSVKADGRLIAQQQLKAHSRESWTATKRFELLIASPAQVEASLNGRSINPLAMANHGRLAITHDAITPLQDSTQTTRATSSKPVSRSRAR